MAARRVRPAILALAQCLPYPPHTGVTNRIYHILTGLQKRFDVFLVPFVRRFHHPDQAAVLAAQEVLSRELTWTAGPVPIPAERRRVRRLLNHLASLLSGQPYVRFEYAARGFRSALAQAVASRVPSLVHSESLDMYSWFSQLPAVPLTVTHHSVESDLLRSRALVTPGAPAQAYLRLQARRMETLEREWAPRVAANLMMSEIDAARLRQSAPGASTLVVPNGVDLAYFTPGKSGATVPGRLVFVGPTYVYQNREAVDWFIAEIWPRIRKGLPTASLDLIGGARDEDARRYSRVPGVSVRGQVADVRPAMRDAALSIVPIRIGGGTRLKILDAWATGTPVLSTSIGCEGLAATDGRNIIIRDDPAGFAEAALALLADASAASDIGASGRATAEAIYDWERITGRLADRYEELLG